MRFVLYAVSTPHASELVETAKRLDWEIAAAVRNVPGLPVPPQIDAITELDELAPELLRLPFAVPQTTPENRHRATADARRIGFTQSLALLDPTATIASSATFASGCYVGARAVVGSGARVGEGVLINRSCSIAHHVELGDYVATGPGVVIAGCCRIGQGAFLGAGAVLAPELELGKGAVIGAGAVVIGDVGAREVVVGNPARTLRDEQHPPDVPWS